MYTHLAIVTTKRIKTTKNRTCQVVFIAIKIFGSKACLFPTFIIYFFGNEDYLYRWFASPPCWWTKQKKICSHSLHKNGS